MFYEAEGTSGRLNFNFLPFSLSETVNADDQRRADAHDGRLLSGRAVRRVGRKRRLEPADARCGLRIRPALELRRAARNCQSHEPRNELRRHEGPNQQESEPINLPGAGPGSDPGAAAVSALRQHEHSQPGAVERVSRAADRSCRSERPAGCGISFRIRRRRRWPRRVAGLALVLVVFALGIALGQALNDGPPPPSTGT